MQIRKSLWAIAACVVTTPFIATAVSAGELDGSSDMLCAVTDVIACLENANCAQGQARDFDLSELIILDSKQKVIRGTRESGHKEVSSIKNTELSGDHLILQGVEHGRGWSFAINTQNGKMSASLVGDGVSFMASGICTAP